LAHQHAGRTDDVRHVGAPGIEARRDGERKPPGERGRERGDRRQRDRRGKPGEERQADTAPERATGGERGERERGRPQEARPEGCPGREAVEHLALGGDRNRGKEETATAAQGEGVREEEVVAPKSLAEPAGGQ